MAFVMGFSAMIVPASAVNTINTKSNTILLWTKADLQAAFVFYRLPSQTWAKAGILPLKSSAIPGYSGATINLGRLTKAEIVFSATRKLPDLKKAKRFNLTQGSYTFSVNGQKKGAPKNQQVTIYFSDREFNQTYLQYKLPGSSWVAFPGKLMQPAPETGYVRYTVSMGDAQSLQARFSDGSTLNDDPSSIFTFKPGTFTVLDGRITTGGPADVASSINQVTPVASVNAVESSTPLPLRTATPQTPEVLAGVIPTGTIDLDPPSAPANLKLSILANGAAGLSWTPSNDNIGVDSYIVYRNDLKLSAISGTSYSDLGFLPGETYTYMIRAMDKAGNLSAVSNEVRHATGADTVPPIPPVVSMLSKSESGVAIQWNGAEDNYSIAIYEVYRDGVKIAETKGTTFTESNLNPDRTFKYAVKAVDGSGNRSVSSNEFAHVTLPDREVPTVPTSLSVIGRSDRTLTILWSPSQDRFGVKHYEVYRNEKSIGTTTSTYFTDKELKPGEVVQYAIVAIDEAGNRSERSQAFMTNTIEDTTPPSKPMDLTVVSKSDSAVKLSWKPSIDNHQLSGYQIIRNGKTLSLVGLLNSFEDSNIQPQNEYTYVVRAVDASGNLSDLGNEVKVITDAGLTIYYKSAGQAYMSYGLVAAANSSANSWTLPPGLQMIESEFVGYRKAIVKLGSAVQIQAAFNNGAGVWDNNNWKNYTINKGVYTVADGKVGTGQPQAELRTTPSPQPSPTTQPSVTPTGTVTALATITPFISPTPIASSIPGRSAQIFYYSTSSQVNIHYRTTDSLKWTVEPGVAMSKSNVPNWFVANVDLPSATASVEAVFHIGIGTNPWDNNQGKNYKFDAGTWSINNRVIVQGVPVGHLNTTPSPTATITATPQVTPQVSTTPGVNPVTRSVTVYYKSAQSNQYIHYSLDGLVWNATPGAELMKTQWEGYVSRTIDLGTTKSIQAVFTNGKGEWDSNAGKNYFIPEGVWTINEAKQIVQGVPQATGTTITSPSVEPIVTPAPTPVPSDAVSVTFKLNYDTANAGVLYMCFVSSGGCNNVPMKWSVGNDWTYTAALKPNSMYQYKYFKMMDGLKLWESADMKNHVYTTSAESVQLESDLWSYNLK